MFHASVSGAMVRAQLRAAARVGMTLMVAGMLAAVPAAAQDDEVLARVNGDEITRADLDLAVEMFSEQLAQVPEGQRQSIVLDALVDMHLVAQAARGEGIAETDIHQRRVDFLARQALRSAYIEKNVEEAVTDEDLRARYEQDIASYTPPEEVHAAHILVATEDEASAVLSDLAAGGDFAEIARERSTDPGSKDNGGDLGFFSKGQMVPEFEAEAFALPVGETSTTPVQTQFGYHIVKVIEKRAQPVPTFEMVREQILPVVQREKFQEVMAGLKAAATIERFDTPAEDAGTDGMDEDADDLDDLDDLDDDMDDTDDVEEPSDEGEPAPAQ